MTKLFKNYEEYLSIIITMIRDFSDEALNTIGLAINVCHSLQDDKEKIFRLNASIIKRILDYHNYNCKNIMECKICQDRIITIDKLRDINERKRPQIHTK